MGKLKTIYKLQHFVGLWIVKKVFKKYFILFVRFTGQYDAIVFAIIHYVFRANIYKGIELQNVEITYEEKSTIVEQTKESCFDYSFSIN